MPGPSASAGRVRANTMNRSATGALVMYCLRPVITQSARPIGNGFRLQPGGVGAGARLGQREGGDDVAGGDAASSQRAFWPSVPKPTSTCPAMPLLVPNIDRSARLV